MPLNPSKADAIDVERLGTRKLTAEVYWNYKKNILWKTLSRLLNKMVIGSLACKIQKLTKQNYQTLWIQIQMRTTTTTRNFAKIIHQMTIQIF